MTESAAVVVLVLVHATTGPIETPHRSAIHFQDVSASSGITYVGRSWGSNWADFDGDGYPDLWLVDHQNPPSLYRNQGDGTFVDIAPQVIDPALMGWYDTHGATWVDFDNDGDPDLYQLADEGTTGPIPDRFFRNDNGQLVEVAAAMGLDYVTGRGRMPIWVDYDGDGLLDVLHTTLRHGDGSDGPTVLFHQGPVGVFTDVSAAVGLVQNTTGGNNFALLGDVTGDGILDLMVQKARFPDNVYDMTVIPFVDPSSSIGLPVTCCSTNALVADLDGDLDNDLLMVHGEQEESFVQTYPDTVETRLQGGAGLPPFYTETGLSFQTDGDVAVDVYPDWTQSEVFIGTDGHHPATLFPLVVSATDSTTWGIFPHTPGVDKGLYIGYDTVASVWQILRTEKPANLVIASTSTISGVTALNWNPADPPPKDTYLENTGTAFVGRTNAAGFVTPSSARCVVAGDFDNDMDLDLYFVTSAPTQNLPNLLYENLGDGTFTLVPGAGGAAGDTTGRGDGAAVADFDRDGFLDLSVTNGTSRDPWDRDGPTYLIRNVGNGNHWIEMDLVGGPSNRDAVGARVLATAGGVTQLREQNSGIHYRGQDYQRIHFGLGANTQVDELSILWPSGTLQVIHDIPADQIIQVVEGIGTPVADRGPGTPVLTHLTSYPNPFASATKVAFSLARSGPVELTVHDVTGRVVSRLLDGDMRPAGITEVSWTGRDDAGRRVASGVYFLRLRAGSLRETRKIVILGRTAPGQ